MLLTTLVVTFEIAPVAPQGVAPPGARLAAVRLKFGGVVPKYVASTELASAVELVTSGSDTPLAMSRGKLRPVIFMLVSTLKDLFAAVGASFTALTVIVKVWSGSAELSTPPLA